MANVVLAESKGMLAFIALEAVLSLEDLCMFIGFEDSSVLHRFEW